MSEWRLAKCLAVLRDQVNASAPGRSKDHDGTIGDAAHSARTSDHNPNDDGIVCAIDFTHDPSAGFDARRFTEILRQNKDPRLKYVIFDRQIFGDPGYGARNNKVPWAWSAYNGENPHDKHCHVSVYASSEGVTSPWKLDSLPAAPQIDPRVGRGSWFGQYEGKYSWVDKEDEPGSNALGVPEGTPGIALYNRDTLGKYFNVTAPNGVTQCLRQIDIGPNPKTGRLIDITAAAAERFGYTPRNFPTDSIFTWAPAPKPEPAPVPTPTPQPQPIPQLDPAVVAELAKMLTPVVTAVVQNVVQKGPGFWSTLFGSAVTGSPFIAIGLMLLQVFLTNADVMGMPGVGGTPTANNAAGGLLAMFVAGIANWFRPKEPAK